MRGNMAARCWLQRVAGCSVVLVLVLVLAGCAGAPVAPVVVSPLAAGAARVWFYRDYEPSVSLNLANVALNGASVGYVQPDGSAIHRDVPAGHYHITVVSVGTDVNQDKDVDLAPGQEAFVKILALDSWESGGNMSAYQRDTFYVSVVPPQVARAEMAGHKPSGG
jgi:hypothetical protein